LSPISLISNETLVIATDRGRHYDLAPSRGTPGRRKPHQGRIATILDRIDELEATITTKHP
jgi:hypothetical protein